MKILLLILLTTSPESSLNIFNSVIIPFFKTYQLDKKIIQIQAIFIRQFILNFHNFYIQMVQFYLRYNNDEEIEQMIQKGFQ